MTIHTTHPFPAPDDDVRRLRGRIGGAVSLWTAGDADNRAGLTVSSLAVANGSPGHIVGLLDPDSDLASVLASSRRAVVHLLEWEDQVLAEAFAGSAPAPGGPFRQREWTDTEYGPALVDRTRVTVELEISEPLGWSTLVTARIAQITLVEERRPLEHRRGRYRSPE